MAVVQISKIQIRRGRENDTGIPQLAGGEMAWAVDTQRLYIGNGAVSEGSPAVGNTRIVTTADNLLDIADRYVYKVNDSTINTSGDENYPIIRTLQDRLDERVSASAYGVEPGDLDQTVNIQRALDNLYLNSATMASSTSRVTLEFAPGTYKISSTIYIPSHARIVGAGIQKTIFQFTATGTTVFEYINESSTDTVRSVLGSTTYINQPKHCLLKGFTLIAEDSNITAIELNAVRDSAFEDIEIFGAHGDSSISATSKGIGMYAVSSVVTCQRNTFNRITNNSFTYAVWARDDIVNNTFENNSILNCQYGFNFGTGANLSDPGQQFGPRKNNILHSYFDNIDRYGILITNGYGNKSNGNTFINVGNDGGGNTNNTYSQIYFISKGNSSIQDNFDRALSLSSGLASSDYLPEVDGSLCVDHIENLFVSLSTNFSTAGTNLFRLPVTRDTAFEINYLLKSNNIAEVRKGKIHISVDFSAGTVQLVDDYEYTGVGTSDNIGFLAEVSSNSLYVKYYNLNVSDNSVMTYTYRVLS
jgi:hypothetical protein